MTPADQPLQAVLTPQQSGAVLRVVAGMDRETLLVAAAWTEAMLRIRAAPLSQLGKARLALRTTFASRATWPVLKALWRILRQGAVVAGASRAGRVGMVSAAALALFSGQAAGIAALGTAVGLPLWVVIGGGYAFAEALQGVIVATLRDGGAPTDRTGFQP